MCTCENEQLHYVAAFFRGKVGNFATRWVLHCAGSNGWSSAVGCALCPPLLLHT